MATMEIRNYRLAIASLAIAILMEVLVMNVTKLTVSAIANLVLLVVTVLIVLQGMSLAHLVVLVSIYALLVLARGFDERICFIFFSLWRWLYWGVVWRDRRSFQINFPLQFHQLRAGAVERADFSWEYHDHHRRVFARLHRSRWTIERVGRSSRYASLGANHTAKSWVHCRTVTYRLITNVETIYLSTDQGKPSSRWQVGFPSREFVVCHP